MEPSSVTAVKRSRGHVTPTPKLERVSVEKDRGCNGSSKKDDCQRTEMATPLQGNSNLARVRQMQEPQVGGVPRSVLQRLLAMPSAGNSPIQSPRRRCSAASASIVAMVHSPRVFANGDTSSLEKRGSSTETPPSQWSSPTFQATEFGSYESSSNCSSQASSPIPTGQLVDHVIPSDDAEDENIHEVVMLRQLVALLVKSLEQEKKRRASEQHLMQKKIIELQSMIRDSEYENDQGMGFVRKTPSAMQNDPHSTRESELLANNQVRRWSAPTYEDEESLSSDCLHKQKDADEEEAVAPKLTPLRSHMHAIVIDSQRETQILRTQLENVKRGQNKREKELQLETTVKITALEQKHAAATTQLAQQAANSAAQVGKLEAEKLELVACMHAQQERLKRLERGLGGKQIAADFR